MSEPQNDDIERSFDRLNRPQEYLEAKDGLGATRQGLYPGAIGGVVAALNRLANPTDEKKKAAPIAESGWLEFQA